MSDPTGTLATPIETLVRRRGKRPPLRALEAIAREHEVKALVMGLPLDPSGKETEWTATVRTVGDTLAERLEMPVYYIDERFTSALSERRIREMDLSAKKRRDKGLVDSMAAMNILQRHLDGGDSDAGDLNGGDS